MSETTARTARCALACTPATAAPISRPRWTCKAVAEYARSLPNVVVSREYKYMCSDPGQDLIRQDIRDHQLNRIVVASCSPHLHEHTFRTALKVGGLNPFFFHMVNIREQASWVHDEQSPRPRAKAKDLVRAAVRRVACHEALERGRVAIHPDVLVVGGGIAGIHAALTLANAGKHVFLVEREATIGGHMARFDKTFPTLDCAACILTPKMSAVRAHPNITLWTYAEVTQVDGFVGNYKVTVNAPPAVRGRRPVRGLPRLHRSLRLQAGQGPRRVQHGPGQAQAHLHSLPAGRAAGARDRSRNLHPVQDPESARRPAWMRAASVTPSTCGRRPEQETIEVGTVILSTGFQTFDAGRRPEYGYGVLSQRLHARSRWSAW